MVQLRDGLRDAAAPIARQNTHADAVSLPFFGSHGSLFLVQSAEQPDQHVLDGRNVGFALRGHGHLPVSGDCGSKISPDCDRRINLAYRRDPVRPAFAPTCGGPASRAAREYCRASPRTINAAPAAIERALAKQGRPMKIDAVLEELKIPREAYRVIMLMPLV